MMPWSTARAMLLALGAAALSTTAHADGGVVVIGPPALIRPPVVYASPPVVYQLAPAPARSCYAGAYVCPLTRTTPSGGKCSCPSNDGRRASGRAH